MTVSWQPWHALVWGVIAFGGPSIARAAELEAQVAVDRADVRVGESLKVQLLVSGSGGQGVPEPELPAGIERHFEVSWCMPGVRSMMGTHMAAQQSRTLDCLLVAHTAGEFKLGFEVAAHGGGVRSNAVNLRIRDAEVDPVAEPSGDAPGVPSDTLESLRTRGIAVAATVDKLEAYVGEQVTYQLDLYEARNFLDPHFRSPPTFKDFLTQELPVDEPRVESAGGQRYRIRPAIRRALFAQRAGALEIGGAEIAVGLRGRLRSAPITIEVKPLPAEGQPPTFSANNVGQYELEGAVDRTSVSVGDPFTYTLRVRGKGNIEVVDPGPWPEIEGVRQYEPKIETTRDGEPHVGGERRYSFLLIPEQPGTLVLPGHKLDYFDPAAGSYRQVESKPLSIEVRGSPTPVAAAEPTAALDQASALPDLAPVVADATVPRRLPKEPWLTAKRWFYGMVAVPGVALLGLAGGFAWRRLGPDEIARLRARSRARRHAFIQQAERAVADGAGFHAIVGNLLHELAVERAGPEGVGLPRPRLVALLERRGVAPGDLRELERLLDDCDAARFGARVGTRDERRALLDDALALARRTDFAKGGL